MASTGNDAIDAEFTELKYVMILGIGETGPQLMHSIIPDGASVSLSELQIWCYQTSEASSLHSTVSP